MKPLKKILIVDDEEGILEVFYNFFSERGIEVIKCQDLSKAKYAVRNQEFNAVIADVCLTGIDKREGLKLLNYVMERSPATKVVIMTAYGSRAMAQEALNNGAALYFDKPLDLGTLEDKMKEFGILP